MYFYRILDDYRISAFIRVQKGQRPNPLKEDGSGKFSSHLSNIQGPELNKSYL